jgi:magnesium transporter
MTEKRLKEKEVKQLLESNRLDELKRRFAQTDPADVADLLEGLDAEDREKIFSGFDNEMASEVIVEMEQAEADDMVDRLTPDKIAGMIKEMAPDDAADLIGELENEERQAVFDLLTGDEKSKINNLLTYDQDSAGGIMTPEVCAVSADSTVQEAMNSIINADYSDPVSMVFAVDAQKKLVGSINISNLISKPPAAFIKDLIEGDPIYAMVDEDQETVANNFRKYDLYVMPVVDNRKRLVGRITVDDVMDVLHEEASEDMARMAGAPDIEVSEASPLKIAKMRLPWLMITLFTGMVISIIIQKLIGFTKVEGMAAFVPMIMAMGGNTGMQASAVTIRSIALGEIEFSKLFSVFSREAIVGIMMGIACGLLTAFIVWINVSFFDADVSRPPLKLAFVVAVSMCAAMTFAAFTGTALPIFLNRFNIDPALASGPFVTTGNDLSACLIYFSMCIILLN